jgi:hypothetical protein
MCRLSAQDASRPTEKTDFRERLMTLVQELQVPTEFRGRLNELQASTMLRDRDVAASNIVAIDGRAAGRPTGDVLDRLTAVSLFDRKRQRWLEFRPSYPFCLRRRSIC